MFAIPEKLLTQKALGKSQTTKRTWYSLLLLGWAIFSGANTNAQAPALPEYVSPYAYEWKLKLNDLAQQSRSLGPTSDFQAQVQYTQQLIENIKWFNTKSNSSYYLFKNHRTQNDSLKDRLIQVAANVVQNSPDTSYQISALKHMGALYYADGDETYTLRAYKGLKDRGYRFPKLAFGPMVGIKAASTFTAEGMIAIGQWYPNNAKLKEFSGFSGAYLGAESHLATGITAFKAGGQYNTDKFISFGAEVLFYGTGQRINTDEDGSSVRVTGFRPFVAIELGYIQLNGAINLLIPNTNVAEVSRRPVIDNIPMFTIGIRTFLPFMIQNREEPFQTDDLWAGFNRK